MRGPAIRRGRYEIRLATMVDLIKTVYTIDAERVLGGPNWLTAKPMLQSLLTDRFKLTFHNDTQSIPAYGLKAGKHPQLKEADSSAEAGCKFIPPAPPGPGGPPPGPFILTFACRNMTMAAFAEALHTTIFVAPQYLNERVWWMRRN